MRCVLAEIRNGTMILNDFGKIVSDNLKQIPNIYQHTEINEFIVMPNHIHIVINIIVGDANFASPTFAPPTFTESPSEKTDRSKCSCPK